MALFPARSNPRWRRLGKFEMNPLMGFPIHFYEIERSSAGIWERIMCEE